MERESLLREYEETIHKQAALLKRQQSTIENLREELSSVHSKLLTSGKQYQNKVEALSQQVQSGTLQDSSEESYLLKQELETALKEKELCQAESKRHASEVQRLRQEVGSLQTVSGDGNQPPVIQVREYERVIQALEEETQRLRSEVAKMEDEKMETLKVNIGLKKMISSLESQLEQEAQENHVLRSTSHGKEKTTRDMKDSYDNLNRQFVDQSEDLRVLVTQTRALQKNKDRLSKILMTVDARLKEANVRVSESVRIAEDALVEKDAALLREKHALNEVSRLESTVSSLMVEAGEKAQTEITKIKDDYNSSIKNMSEEVVKFEMALNEKQLLCAKAQREQSKTASEIEEIEAELKRRKEEHQEEILNLHHRISSQENRIITLSAEKDDMSTANLQCIHEYEQQREELLGRIQELEQRLMELRTDFESLRIEHEEIKGSYSYVLEELEKLKQENKSVEHFLKRQLRVKTEELEEVTASSRLRLDATDSSHMDVIKQLNDNIAVLQESYSKMQSQMDSQKRDYEERISDISHRLQDSTLKCKNALQSFHETKTELAVTKDLASQYKDRIEEVQGRLSVAEQRFSTLRKKPVSSGNNLETF